MKIYLFAADCYFTEYSLVGESMASLHCSARPFQSIVGFRRPTRRADIPAITVLQPGASAPPTPTPSNFRFKNAIRLQVKQRLLAVFASNTNPSDGESPKEKYNGIKTEAAEGGPPFLTILAGILIFLVICWIIGSILLWLIGLIVHSPPSK
ncbi:hypothetical protein F0562_014556 [Nyssa sinensis]|uniref:Uncharacterized protein n=1 Tax=Nyssa sinensis TaxID=561372 RepID=A0A5J4ZP74_9ASTE|nr:hypothetical protein F0562_014556 [Nyssa sinensis]